MYHLIFESFFEAETIFNHFEIFRENESSVIYFPDGVRANCEMCGVIIIGRCFVVGLLDTGGIVIFFTIVKFLSRGKHFTF